MKNIRIDGRLQRVFVLKETTDRIVYIPLTSIFLEDYKVLLELEKEGGEMLKSLSKHTLKNGRNALVQYENIIQVAQYTDSGKGIATRLRKPSEISFRSLELTSSFSDAEKGLAVEQPQEEQKPARRKPGPKPGSKRKPKVEP